MTFSNGHSRWPEEIDNLKCKDAVFVVSPRRTRREDCYAQFTQIGNRNSGEETGAVSVGFKCQLLTIVAGFHAPIGNGSSPRPAKRQSDASLNCD